MSKKILFIAIFVLVLLAGGVVIASKQGMFRKSFSDQAAKENADEQSSQDSDQGPANTKAVGPNNAPSIEEASKL